jgi:hypothetical protein
MSDITKAIGNAIDLMHETLDERVHETLYEIICVAQELKEDKAARENPQPLSLDELKERIGNPVYLVHDYEPEKRNGWYEYKGTGYKPDYLMFRGFEFYGERLNKEIWAYDHEPKEATKCTMI